MMKRIYFYLTVFIICLTAGRVYSSDVTKSFVKAGEAYEAGDYDEAASLYEETLKEVKNGDLYYNLGNCYFKKSEIGLALANYLRARRYKPRSDDINDNIRYIRTLTKDKIEDKVSLKLIHKVFFFYDYMNIKEFFYAFMIFNVLFFLLVSVGLFIKESSILKQLKRGAFVILLLFIVGGVLNYHAFYFYDRGIVTGSEVSIRSGSSSNDTALFNLHEGAEFIVLEESGDWIKIMLADKKRGWISKDLVEII